MGKRNGFVNKPILVSKKMSGKDLIVGKYYEDIRRIYQFDESCCVDVPDADESIFVSNFTINGSPNSQREAFDRF
jgi:hypothetical protein